MWGSGKKAYQLRGDLCGAEKLINELVFLRGEDERMQGLNEERNKMLFIELDWKVNVAFFINLFTFP